jgi:hypothetical protein
VWSEATPIATRTGVDGYRFAPPTLRAYGEVRLSFVGWVGKA